MPRKGFLNEALRELHPAKELHPIMDPMGPNAPFVIRSSNLAGGMNIRVLHSISVNGPKLVELDEEAAGKINLHQDVCALPVFKYNRPFPKKQRSKDSDHILPAGYPGSVPSPKKTKTKSRSFSVTLTVTKKKEGKIVPVGSGLLVTAFSDYSANQGDEQATDDSGKVTLELATNTIERLYCPYVWGWGGFYKNLTVHSPMKINLPPLRENFTDSVRRYYKQSRFDPKSSVTVGVIDTGVGRHDDLNVIGRFNVVSGERKQDDVEVVDPHGTFVAGLMGSRGNRYPKLRGLAPGVPIGSYRVFGGLGEANSYTVMMAISYAQSDGCDILNLSIENGPNDEALHRYIIDAVEKGMLVVVAAGNDNRKDINYPAAYPEAVAVSAMGCMGTFPSGALEETYVNSSPGGNNPKEFIASFSNVGDQIDITALGVGVLSTLPNNKYGSCSGTSMAAPVVTGAIASLLSQNPDIYDQKNRDQARSDAIKKLLFDNCIPRGFKARFEGKGMPDPKKV